jgi:hypothetical protein
MFKVGISMVDPFEPSRASMSGNADSRNVRALRGAVDSGRAKNRLIVAADCYGYDRSQAYAEYMPSICRENRALSLWGGGEKPWGLGGLFFSCQGGYLTSFADERPHQRVNNRSWAAIGADQDVSLEMRNG